MVKPDPCPDGCPDWVWRIVLSARSRYLRTPRHLRAALVTPGHVACVLGMDDLCTLARGGHWPLSPDLVDVISGPPAA